MVFLKQLQTHRDVPGPLMRSIANLDTGVQGTPLFKWALIKARKPGRQETICLITINDRIFVDFDSRLMIAILLIFFWLKSCFVVANIVRLMRSETAYF